MTALRLINCRLSELSSTQTEPPWRSAISTPAESLSSHAFAASPRLRTGLYPEEGLEDAALILLRMSRPKWSINRSGELFRLCTQTRTEPFGAVVRRSLGRLKISASLSVRALPPAFSVMTLRPPATQDP